MLFPDVIFKMMGGLKALIDRTSVDALDEAA
jgi:hypothetical protein